MICQQCGDTIGTGMLICPRCGNRVANSQKTQSVQEQVPHTNRKSTSNQINTVSPLTPATFWQRVFAFFVDSLPAGMTAYLAQESLIPIFGGIIVWWLYYSLFESSSWQATPGKRLLGLKVTDVNGVHINFKRASARFFGRLLSSAILGIGFLFVIWTKHKQGLHDLLANTLVLRKP